MHHAILCSLFNYAWLALNPSSMLPPDIKSIVETSSTTSDIFQSIHTSVSEEQSQMIFDLTKGQSPDKLWRDVRHLRKQHKKKGQCPEVLTKMKSIKPIVTYTFESNPNGQYNWTPEYSGEGTRARKPAKTTLSGRAVTRMSTS